MKKQVSLKKVLAQQLDPLCRYVLFDTPGSGDILETNLSVARRKSAAVRN